MRRERRRALHYLANSLCDGTVLAAYPIRKPTPKVMKRDHLAVDEDGVCREWLDTGSGLAISQDAGRFRFMDIISANLNTRRAIRHLVLPRLAVLQQQVEAVQGQLDRIERLLADRPGI